jgi:surface protein
MNYKKLLWSLLAIIVLWSCGKDDDPAPPAPTAAPTIANFTPESGPVGTEITINGTNFNTTVASNTVKIGSATATVTAATATQLKATVPTGATTAKVTVTVGGKTATSTKDFNVTVPNEDDPNGDNPDGDDPNGDDPNGDDPDGDDPDGDDPTNEAPTAEDQSFEVAEDVAEGEVIGTVEGSDPEEDDLTFALVTDESELFQAAENGEISLAEGKSLDFETTTEHVLTLTVSDGTNEPVEFTVTVTVTDVNESPITSDQSFEVSEAAVSGQLIGTVSAIDPEEDSLAFILVTDESELFHVAENGEITLAEGKSLDFETDSEHTLTLSVTDGTNDPVEFTVTIAVIDLVEADPILTSLNNFVLKFNVSANQVLTIGTNPNFEYDYTIDWGDNSAKENITDQNPTHQYGAPGVYTVVINGTFPALKMYQGLDGLQSSRNALIDVAKWGNRKWQSMEDAFRECKNLVEFSATDKPDLSETTSMRHMFYNATSFNGNIGNWVTTNITDMYAAFGNATSFNKDVSSWNTSNVTDMSFMFFGASSFNKSLGPWNIVKVTNMQKMLDNCGMTTANYSNTLIGWASKGSMFIPSGITLGAAGLTYCNNQETTSKRNTVLIGSKNWSIVGDNPSPFSCL